MAESFLYQMVSNMLSDFVSDFMSDIVSSAGQQLRLIFKRDEDLEKIRQTLTTVKDFILDAEEKQESDPALKKWIIQVEDVVYDAGDLLDEIDYEILAEKVRAQGQDPGVHAPKKVLKLISFGMGPRIKEIRGRLDKAAADISMFNLRKRVVEQDKNAKNIYREAASKVRSELIIGREKDKELIIESLLEKQNDHHGGIIPIVAIVGFGGLGKTSLARLVYNDAKVADSFKGIWVCVSEEFNVLIIFKKILKCLGVHKVDDWNLNEVQKKIEHKLKGKRYLLVLDDVWNEDILKWDDFSQYLVFGAPGSKIIVTTRSTKVAATMGVHSPYLLKGLNKEQSQDLFEKVAFEGRQIDPKLGQIGKVVAQKCKGVPLSVKCLGGLMRQKPDEKYWLSVQENEIWNNDDVLSVLRLSYSKLSSNLKQCFAFCSLFPKDSEMYKDELIYYWGAQGYIQLRGENANIQAIGDEYFNELLSRSFFEEEEKDMDGNTFCKMHDLIHDLALQVAGSHFYWMKDEKKEIPKEVRHLSLEKYSREVDLILSKKKGIRTMFFRTYSFEDLSIRNVTFSSFNCLRMLNLSRMNIDILPDSIGELKFLKYLNLSGNEEMKVLPDAIVKLHHLQTLLLDACFSLKELPRDIQQLISLEYLNIDYCDDLECLPKGLGELTSLQRLDRFIVGRSIWGDLSTAATLNELSNLDLGNCLKIMYLENVGNVELECKEANLKRKIRLQSLQLYWRSLLESREAWDPSVGGVGSKKDESLLNILEPHPNLKELMVSDYKGARFSSWLSSLTNLVNLEIDKFYYCRDLPPLDHISSLKSLSLQDSGVLEHLPPLHRLSSLESLFLTGLYALEYVANSFPLPCSMSREPFFPSLKKLRISCCLNLRGWWKAKNENQGSIAELPCFPRLSELQIQDCPDLTSMPLFPSLDQELSLKDTSIRPFQRTLKMKMIEASMTSEEASSSLSGSTCHFYSSTALPLSNLKSLLLSDIKDLEALPEGTHQLSSLKALSVKNCPNLRALPDWILNLTSLTKLDIQECLELQCMPKGTPRLTSLEELCVYCHNLRALPNWILNLTSLKRLHICECLESLYLQEGMHSLSSLQGLMVEYCPNRSSLRCSLKALLTRGCPDLCSWTTRHWFEILEELNVQNCPNLEDLLNHIGRQITSLKTLKICKCPELQDLPEEMEDLAPSLEELSISECPKLSERCEKETGILWPRIARIPSIIIDGRQIQ